MNYFEKSDQAITKLSLDIMGQAPRFMAMLDGFVLEGREVANFPRMVAVFMKQYKVTLAQPDAEILPVINMVIAQLEDSRKDADRVSASFGGCCSTVPDCNFSKKPIFSCTLNIE
jgi:hypothetical protein